MSAKTQYFITFTIAFIILSFFFINFNQTVANGLYIILGGGAFALIFDLLRGQKSDLSYPLLKNGFSFPKLILSITPYLIIFFVITFILQALGTIQFSVGEKITTSFSASEGLLADSALTNFFVWGQLIPFIESVVFFGIWLEFIKDNTSLNPTGQLTDKNTWLYTILMGGVFAFFHLNVRFITGQGIDTISFLITFIFGVISTFMTLRLREVSPAIGLHVIMNSMAMARRVGYV